MCGVVGELVVSVRMVCVDTVGELWMSCRARECAAASRLETSVKRVRTLHGAKHWGSLPTPGLCSDAPA
eukprot:5021806-Prymnesium_polylepis.3